MLTQTKMILLSALFCMKYMMQYSKKLKEYFDQSDLCLIIFEDENSDNINNNDNDDVIFSYFFNFTKLHTDKIFCLIKMKKNMSIEKIMVNFIDVKCMILDDFNQQCVIMHHVVSYDIKNNLISINSKIHYNYHRVMIKCEFIIYLKE